MQKKLLTEYATAAKAHPDSLQTVTVDLMQQTIPTPNPLVARILLMDAKD